MRIKKTKKPTTRKKASSRAAKTATKKKTLTQKLKGLFLFGYDPKKGKIIEVSQS